MRRRLTSIEVNGRSTRCNGLRSTSVADETPPDFVFAVKGAPVRHPYEEAARRRGADGELLRVGGAGAGREARADAVAAAAEPRLRAERIEAFLRSLPRTTTRRPSLAPVARRPARRPGGDHRAVERAAAARGGGPATRRSPPTRARLFARHDVAVVVADTAGKWPLVLERRRRRLSYARAARRRRAVHARLLPTQALDRWAARIVGWLGQGLDVFVVLRQRRQGTRAVRRAAAHRAAAGLTSPTRKGETPLFLLGYPTSDEPGGTP